MTLDRRTLIAGLAGAAAIPVAAPASAANSEAIKRLLGFSDRELAENERLWRQETGPAVSVPSWQAETDQIIADAGEPWAPALRTIRGNLATIGTPDALMPVALAMNAKLIVDNQGVFAFARIVDTLSVRTGDQQTQVTPIRFKLSQGARSILSLPVDGKPYGLMATGADAEERFRKVTEERYQRLKTGLLRLDRKADRNGYENVWYIPVTLHVHLGDRQFLHPVSYVAFVPKASEA